MTPHSAVSLINDGHTCSASILMAYAPQFGLTPETAARLTAGFAGGLAQGKTCGAVTAAVMVIGLKYGPGLCVDPYKKELCVYLTQEFCHRFRQKRRTTQCSKILVHNGVDPSDPVQMKHLRGKKICDKIVNDAVVILDQLFCETNADNPPGTV